MFKFIRICFGYVSVDRDWSYVTFQSDGSKGSVVANILDLTTQEALVKLAHLYEEDAKQELWANHFTQMRALIEKEKQGFGKFLYEKLFKDAQNRAYRSGWIRYWHNTEL